MAKNITPEPQDQNGKNIFNAPIRVGRDFIAGDQVNYNIQPPASREEFTSQLQQVQNVLINIQQLTDLAPQKVAELKDVQEELGKAIEQTQKPIPLVSKIKNTLDYTKSVMESLDEGIKTAMSLGSTIALLGTLAANVAHLFGM